MKINNKLIEWRKILKMMIRMISLFISLFFLALIFQNQNLKDFFCFENKLLTQE